MVFLAYHVDAIAISRLQLSGVPPKVARISAGAVRQFSVFDAGPICLVGSCFVCKDSQ